MNSLSLSTVEQWVQWEPTTGLSDRYIIESVYDCGGILTISLLEEQSEWHRIVLRFDHSVIAYRDTNESYRLETMNQLSKNAGDDFYVHWSFFKIHNSDFVRMLAERSGELVQQENLIHFAIITEDFFDVVARREPTVEFVQLKERPFSKSFILKKSRYDAPREGSSELERWVCWKPVAGLATQYRLDRIFEGPGGETVRLIDVKNNECGLSINFGCLSGQSRRTYISPQSAFYRKNAFDQWAFFEVENSRYVQWISDETFGIYQNSFSHLAIVLEDSILEVFSGVEPKVEILNL